MNELEDKVASRIEAAIQGYTVKTNKKISWASLAKEIGYTPQAPTNWKKGKISYKVIQKIADYLGADPTWLMYGSPNEDIILRSVGIGKSQLTNPHTNGFDSNFNIVDVDAELFKKHNEKFEISSPNDTPFPKLDHTKDYERTHIIPRNLEKEMSQDKNIHNNITYVEKQFNNINIKRVKLVPIISYVEAGSFKEAILNSQENFVACYAEHLSENTFALEIQGESMLPDFKPGDKIIVDPEVQPIPGDYVIAQNGEHEATFKKYRPRGYNSNNEVIFELTPLNPDYPILNSADQPIRIIGTVVEHIRSLRRRHT